MRGGEYVLQELAQLFPEATIFTHAARKERLASAITDHPIRESFIAGLPFGRRHPQWFLPLMPTALKRWDLSQFNRIISSESGPVKGIRKPRNCKHFCYCHTPMRYLWDLSEVYYEFAHFPARVAMSVFGDYLRRYDLKSADCVDHFIANSKCTAQRIKRIYGRDATVVYPPVDVQFFQDAPPKERQHFLFVGELTGYKRPDLAVKAMAKRQDAQLLVVGNGPMARQLQRLATPNVRFLGHVSRETLRELYAGAKALLHPGIEDFGIAPVEAMAAGCPVVTYKVGGAAETVQDGRSGVWIDAQTTDALLAGMESLPRDTAAIRAAALPYTQDNFRTAFMAALD